jgi:Ca-activated chloride channel homolog
VTPRSLRCAVLLCALSACSPWRTTVPTYWPPVARPFSTALPAFEAGTPASRTTFEPARRIRAAHGFVIQLDAGELATAPTVHRGLLLFGVANGQRFHAVDAKSGSPRWTLALGEAAVSSAACARGTCTFMTESCTVYGVDALSGEVRWSWWLAHSLHSAPSIGGDRVVIAHRDEKQGEVGGDRGFVLSAFELESGRLRWEALLEADVLHAPVVTADAVYATTTLGTVLGFSLEDGAARGLVADHAWSAPLVHHGWLYYLQPPRVLPESALRQALAQARDAPIELDDGSDPEPPPPTPRVAETLLGTRLDGTGAPLALVEVVGGPQAPPGSDVEGLAYRRLAFHRGHIVTTMLGEVVVLRPNGHVLWRRALGTGADVHVPPPAAAAGRVVAGAADGTVLVLDLATGAVERTFPLDAPILWQPIVADGWIYVATGDGKVLAIDTGDRTLTGWPMAGGDPARRGGG